MGGLSKNNESLAMTEAERAADVLRAAGFEVIRTSHFDLGSQCAVIFRNNKAVFYSAEQIASGEACALEAVRDIAA